MISINGSPLTAVTMSLPRTGAQLNAHRARRRSEGIPEKLAQAMQAGRLYSRAEVRALAEQVLGTPVTNAEVSRLMGRAQRRGGVSAFYTKAVAQ